MVLPSLSECAATLDRLAPAMLNIAARSVVILGIAALAALALRHASAAARHWVWLLGFAGLMLLPILSAVLPAWRVLPRLGAAEIIMIPPVPELPQPNVLQIKLPPAESKSEVASVTRAEILSTKSTAPLVSAPAIAPVSEAPTVSQAPTAPAPRQFRLQWTGWLVIAWMAGSLLLLAHTFLGHLSLWALRRRCAGVSGGRLFDLFNELRQDLGISRRVELLSSPARTMPMTWGLWRVRLLLPEQANTWPPEQLRSVLLHELGHVKRWDCLTQLLAQIACAIYWFNPIGWIADRRMQIERERACDDIVLNAGAEAKSYARHLLHSVTDMPAPRFVAAAVAMARPSTLEERLRAILDGRRDRGGLTARGSLLTTLLVLTALLPVAVLKGQDAPSRGLHSDNGTVAPPTTRPARGTPGARANPAGPRSTGVGGFGSGIPTPKDGPTCSLDATIYDVRLPVDQIGQLDADSLAHAATGAAVFEKALAALGTTQPLYRVSQSVRLSGDHIMIGTETPFITNNSLGLGKTVNSVHYQSTGANFNVAGNVGATGTIDLDLSVQLSSASDGGVPIAADVKAPNFRHATISHKGPVQAHKSFVVISVDANSVDAAGKAVAYIGRITVGEAQSTSTQPAGGE